MTYETDKAGKEQLEALVAQRGAKLKEYPRRACGLVADDVRNSVAYQNDKAAYDRTFAALRKFNALFVKRYKKEIQAERRARLT